MRLPALAEHLKRLRPDTDFICKTSNGRSEFEQKVGAVKCLFDNSASKSQTKGLGMQYRAVDVSVLDTANSIIDTGFLEV
jgi:hypothetical protein